MRSLRKKKSSEFFDSGLVLILSSPIEIKLEGNGNGFSDRKSKFKKETNKHYQLNHFLKDVKNGPDQYVAAPASPLGY